MKYLTTIFWGFILGHVCFYLGSSLTQATYDATQASILGLVISLATFLVAHLLDRLEKLHN